MIRDELVGKLRTQINITKVNADQVVQAFCNAIMTGVKQSGKVVLKNFGTFRIRTMPARVGSRPVTREPINLPERKRPWFTPSKNLNAIVNDGGRAHGR